MNPDQIAENPSEHSQQVALFCFAQQSVKEYPCLKFMHCIPNGGGRSKAEAGRLKAEGVRAGVPDIHLPYPNGGFPGLYLEMKRAKTQMQTRGRLQKEQKEFIQYLESQGYKMEVVFGYYEARDALINYLLLN